jgi:serine/threonine-protein kinase
MGEVYRVEHIRMGKIAAMKLLHPQLTREPDVVARFQREAKAVSRLSHPHTVQVFDFGEHDGTLFLVMEFVRGRDLGSLCREGGPLPYARALPLVVQLCLALEEAHEAGIVHRDVKPENVLVSRGTDGTDYVKVLDFGLALLRGTKDQANITAQGNVIGTPYYMAPEQIRGESVDARADIYAIGATLYRLLTGFVPYPAKTPVGVLTKCLTEPLVPPRQRRPDLDIPEVVEAVIMRAMAKNPAERFQTTRAFRKALEACIAALSVPTVRVLGGSPAQDPQSMTSMPAFSVSVSPFTADNNLRREDMDAFERRLKRRRVMSIVTPILMLLGVGAGLAWWLTLPAEPSRGMQTEREPNSTTAEANPIARGRAVRGQIGKRLSATQSDVDVYSFEVKARGAVVLYARLTGIPYIDLSLQIYDAEGRELAAVNNGPARTDEVLPNLVLRPGRHFAVVQEVASKTPGTNIDDWYRLTIDWRPLGPGDEVEPNDSLEAANRIRSGERVEGFLARPDDVDMFRPEGRGGGRFSVTVSGLSGAEVQLRVIGLRPKGLAEEGAGKSASAPPGTPPEPKGKEAVHLAGHPYEMAWIASSPRSAQGGAVSLADLSWPLGAPAPLIVVSRKPGSSSQTLAEKPYLLNYSFQRPPPEQP